MLFWPKCFHFQKRIVSGSITSARLVTGVLISSSSITKWDGLQVAIIHITFVKARLFSLMNKANFLLQNSLAFLSHVYKLNVFTIFADRKYDRHIGNSMWNIQNSVRGNVPNCLLSASNSRIFSAFQFQNTLGSRYPNCSDTETPPSVIRYPNKFYPNYLILGVSISELVRIPRPVVGLVIRTQKNSDSLSEQILSEQGSRYPNRVKKVTKKRKMALSQLLS